MPCEANTAGEPVMGRCQSVIPAAAMEQPPQAVGFESRTVAAAADGSYRVSETSCFKDVGGLMRPLCRPAHGLEGEGQLIR